jgi:hypothetical protein
VETKQHLELTIRAATLIKSLSQLIGVHDAHLAKLMFMEATEQYDALARFIVDVQKR